MIHCSGYCLLLPIFVGALLLSQSPTCDAQSKPPPHASISLKQQHANARFVALWTDDDGEVEETKLRAMTLRDVKEALAHGADVNAKDHQGMTALIWVCSADNAPVARYLIAHGADIHAKCPNGNVTVLNAAALSGDLGLVRLVVKGADPKAIESGFLNAAMGGQASVARFLLTHGANVNAKFSDGDTALMLAAQAGNLETVQLLLSKGADIHARNSAGQNALGIAMANHRSEAIKPLQSAEAK